MSEGASLDAALELGQGRCAPLIDQPTAPLIDQPGPDDKRVTDARSHDALHSLMTYVSLGERFSAGEYISDDRYRKALRGQDPGGACGMCALEASGRGDDVPSSYRGHHPSCQRSVQARAVTAVSVGGIGGRARAEARHPCDLCGLSPHPGAIWQGARCYVCVALVARSLMTDEERMQERMRVSVSVMYLRATAACLPACQTLPSGARLTPVW
jgi:hypothetical protein